MIETRSLYFSDNSLTYHKAKHAFCFQIKLEHLAGVAVNDHVKVSTKCPKLPL